MGNFGSVAHLGAIGLGGSIFNFLYWNFAFIRMSVVGLTAQEYGRKNSSEIASLLGRSLLVSVAGALLLLVFQSPIEKLAFIIIKGDPFVESVAKEYFQVRIWAAPATIGLMALTGWFVGMQNARAPMIISISINVINIGLSYYFVKYLEMGSRGVALGTVIGQYSGLTIAIFFLIAKYRKYLVLMKLNVLINFSAYNRFFSVNLDIFIRTLAVVLVLTSYNFISANKGEIILGVNVIFLQLVFAFSFFIDGFANAAEALTGKYFGRRDLQKLKKVVACLFFWGTGIACLFSLIYYFFWQPIIKIYTKEPEIIQESYNYIGWIIAIPLVSILTFIWDGVFLGVTATAEQRNATLVSAVLFFLTYIAFKNAYGNHALLLAQLVFFGMRGILQTFYYKPAIINPLKIK